MKISSLLLLCALTAASGCMRLPKVFRDRDPLTADEHARLGAAYDAQGEKKEAYDQYRLALAMDPRHDGAWMALGNRAFEDGEFKKAGRHYKRVLKLVPKHPGASNNLAMVYLALNRDLDQAEKLAQDALAQEGPLKPHILDTLAQIEQKRAVVNRTGR